MVLGKEPTPVPLRGLMCVKVLKQIIYQSDLLRCYYEGYLCVLLDSILGMMEL